MNSMIFAPYWVFVLAERESKPDLGGRLRLSSLASAIERDVFLLESSPSFPTEPALW